MIQQITTALQHQDYQEAKRLLDTLPSGDPRGELLQGQLQEATQDWDSAEQTYRALLRQDNGPKITLAARQGLKRLTEQRQNQRQQRLSTAVTDPAQKEYGILILEALAPEVKTEAAKAFAKVMDLDPYTARLLLPSRGWRLYRAGAVGTLQMYGQDLQAAEIPTFWTPLKAVRELPVHQVCYLETTQNPVRVIVTNDRATGQTRSLQFRWSDVSARVEGLVPIFEEVVDRDPRGKLQRKHKTQDHAQFCDLHLPKQGYILRLYDAAYQFNQGAKLTETSSNTLSLEQGTSWVNWRSLVSILNQNLSHAPIWSEFTVFAETAIDHPDVLDRLQSHINLFRRSESYWDQAFHLYSSLVFLKNQPDRK